ncbi:MAG: lytic transglycosylase domain-containing protein [Deltaproteobacteria bacterium]|nr:lytic transglycosylase domain-containing protein [Deltaproteobacteria bacterium]
MIYFRIFIITFLIACPSILRADIYRVVTDDNVIHFSNDPTDPRAELYLREGPQAPPPAAGGVAGSLAGWMMEYAEKYSRAQRLSPALVKAVIRAESNGNRHAVSRKGAQGAMQLMPFTSKRLKVTNPFDPIENIEGGVKYLKELLGAFRGNVVHAVAAYNAGPAAVRRYGGVPPYQETQVYVKRVMGYYRQYLVPHE